MSIVGTVTYTRKFYFRGLTEEVVKTSVKSSPSDNDFGFVLKEDGDSASDWAVYDNDPAGRR